MVRLEAAPFELPWHADSPVWYAIRTKQEGYNAELIYAVSAYHRLEGISDYGTLIFKSDHSIMPFTKDGLTQNGVTMSIDNFMVTPLGKDIRAIYSLLGLQSGGVDEVRKLR